MNDDDVQTGGVDPSPRESVCPFCQAALPTAATVCPSCKVAFPWSAPIRELQTKVEQLSAAQDRARAGWLARLFGSPAAKTATKTPGEPTKEVAQAPHLATIMLSIAGSILVGIQIAIFWQQTRLFRQQAEAANVERAEKLRGRVGSNLAHGEVLRRFEDAFRESNLKRNSFACDEGCQRVPLQVAYKRFVELRSSSSDADSPADKTAANAGDVSVNAAAATLVELSDLLGKSIAETDAESAPLGRPSEKTRGWAQRLFNNTLQPALLSCAIGQPVQDIRIEAVFILAAADEDLGVYVPATLDEMLPRLAGDTPKFSRWVPSTSPPTLG